MDIEPVVTYISGWELYEKIGNEYEFVEEYIEWSTDFMMFEPGEVRTFVAKYYIINSKGEKLYSDYSNEYIVD